MADTDRLTKDGAPRGPLKEYILAVLRSPEAIGIIDHALSDAANLGNLRLNDTLRAFSPDGEREL